MFSEKAQRLMNKIGWCVIAAAVFWMARGVIIALIK